MDKEIQMLTDRLKPKLRLVGKTVFDRNRLSNSIKEEVKTLTSFMKFHNLRDIRHVKTFLFYNSSEISEQTFNNMSKLYSIVEPILDSVDRMNIYIAELLKQMKSDRDRFIFLLEQQGLDSTSEIKIVKTGKTGKYLQLTGAT